ncbi:translation initiation factor IF-1 [Candidatus Dojkabacteria bacterium]|nr:translation initiation factor IF-1 [Candidatus Dojkabacteria bacterium]
MEPKVFEIDGVVTEALPQIKFIVEIEVSGKKRQLVCHLAGRMKLNYIKIVVGDKVKLEINSYDPTKGRIIYRHP